ncbi:hypothetical protein BH20ACT2_BH20ACT2_23770 [soil metagenome]
MKGTHHVATVDHHRRSIRLSGAELAAATLLLSAPGDPDLAQPAVRHHLDALADAGAIDDGRLLGWLAELVALISAAQLRVLVQTYAVDALVTHSLWFTPGAGALASPHDDATRTVSPTETVSAPWTIAGLVGLGQRPPPAHDQRIELRRSLLDDAFATLAEGDPDAATAALAHGGLDTPDAAALVALARGRRLSWRVTSVFIDADGQRQERELAMVDGGHAGLWRSTLQGDAGPDDDPVVRLEPRRASQTWADLVALLPGTRTGAAAPAG